MMHATVSRSTGREGQFKCLNMRFHMAEQGKSPGELVLFRVPLADLFRDMGCDEPAMLVNSESLGNGTIGLVRLSARGEKLNERGFHLLKIAIRYASSDAARPLDWMENLHPALWLREGKSPALAVVNWTDQEQRIVLPAGRFPRLADFTDAKDVWSGSRIKTRGTDPVVIVPARDVAWFVVAKREKN